MIHPLIYLSALSLLAGAATVQQFNGSSVLDISSCPIAYYGQIYNQLDVTFTSENVAICFNVFGEECIVGPQLTEEVFDFFVNSTDNGIFHTNLPNLDTVLSCTVNLKFTDIGKEVELVLGNFGTQAAVYLFTELEGSTVFDVMISDQKVNKLNVTNTPEHLQEFSVVDISACRFLGAVYPTDSVVSFDPDTCTNVTCSSTAELLDVRCGPSETCQGNNICLMDTIYTCTLVGPTVIDFNGNVAYVEDRCAYVVLSDLSDPDYRVIATFQERRRKDVSFLDSFIVEGPGVQINLKQDGIFRLGDTSITSEELSQLIPGMQFDLDQNGRLSTFSMFNYTFTFFFDGTMAQFSFSAPTQELSLQGLCGNSSESLSELRVSDLSAGGCEILYNDATDSSINCTTATEFCRRLLEDTFSSCHSFVDPMPYISACIDTLCSYPSVDGVNCEFFGAYVRACSLHGINTANDWSSVADCSLPPPFCQGRTCTPNEFCAEGLNSGETSCFCRALFASKYRETNTLGSPTVCGPKTASLTLVGCLLEEKGIDYSALHLFDPTCRGQIDEQTHNVTFSYDNINTCGTKVTANGSQIIYLNAVTNLSNPNDIITRSDQVYINFTCIQTQPDDKTVSFKIKDSSVIVHVTSEIWNYTLTMNAYTDPKHTKLLNPDSEVLLDQRIWVELNSYELDDNLIKLVTNSCWASPNPSPNGDLKYDLIVNGCPNDPTVTVLENGQGTTNSFAFKMFRFIGYRGEIYLHCQVQLCIENCAKACKGARGRRSLKHTHKSEHSAFISMAWIN
ncbi:Alpha-tectorin Precursor [Channa argus]|uniref:Alpha-tectorin n=1 Tax=Channa argus TaxID=215402 RepID=A0A6G1Q6U1_CHAAH|nr:Alpha-tectorin Precursor [Channa argus]